jgi:hypothetical protein
MEEIRVLDVWGTAPTKEVPKKQQAAKKLTNPVGSGRQPLVPREVPVCCMTRFCCMVLSGKIANDGICAVTGRWVNVDFIIKNFWERLHNLAQRKILPQTR